MHVAEVMHFAQVHNYTNKRTITLACEIFKMFTLCGKYMNKSVIDFSVSF
jgi:hypothetical protein